MSTDRLRYHPEILAFAALEAGWSHSDEPIERFSSIAEEFSKHLNIFERQRQTALTEMSGEPVSAQPDPTEDSKASRVLGHFVPFGHADTLVVCEVDDFEVIHQVVECYPHPVEEVIFALCPDEARFNTRWTEGLAKKAPPFGPSNKTPQSPFRRPRELFYEISDPVSDHEDWLLFAKLRITPMLSLGRALCAKRLIFDAIARAIGETWADLSSFWDRDDSAVKKLMPDLKSLQLFRIALVDLQEEEDIGIIIRCRNLSLAACLLTAAQNLTLDDVRSINEEEFKAIENSRIFKALRAEVEVASGNGREFPFGSNHVFRWTRSSVSVTLKRFTGDFKKFCNMQKAEAVSTESASPAEDDRSEGYVSFITAISFLPGHHFNAYELLPQWMKPEEKSAEGRPQYLLHTFGTEDLLLPSMQSRETNGRNEPVGPFLVPAHRLVEACWTLLRAINQEFERSRANNSARTRHLTAWSTKVSVPVPNPADLGNSNRGSLPFHRALDPGHHSAAFHSLLAAVKDLPPFDAKTSNNPAEGPVGMSATLRRSLLHLKANFTSVYTSFYTFDVVLDYLDVALVLERITKEGLMARMGDRAGADDYLKRIGLNESLAIAEILEAIRDGMEFRLRHIYPESPVRDHSLDLRTSVLQPVLAAEAVLKSAIAVLRKDLLGIDDEKASESHHYVSRRCIGAILKLGFKPGLDAVQYGFLHTVCSNAKHLQGNLNSPETYRTRLAVFEADFPRLLHIPSYCIFYHEAFHLVFDELTHPGPEIESLEPIEEKDEEKEPDRVDYLVQETFVQLCMLLFVFGGDTRTLLRHHATVISTYPQVLEGLGKLTIEEQTESVRSAVIDNLFPALLAVWVLDTVATRTATKVAGTDPSFSAKAAWVARIPLEFATSFRLDQAIDQMMEIAVSIKPWIADWDWIFPTPETLSETRPRLGRWFVQVADSSQGGGRLKRHSNHARLLYVRHCRRILQESDPSSHERTPLIESLLEPKDGAMGNDAWPAEDVERFLTLSESVDSLILKSWAKDLSDALGGGGDEPTVTPLASTDFDAFAKPAAGSVVDPNLLVRRTLYHYVKLTSGEGEAWGDTVSENGEVLSYSTRALKRKEPDKSSPAKPTWTFPSSGRPYAPILIDRISPVPFIADPIVRKWLTGLQIGAQLTLWDVASRCRARRAITLKKMKRQDQHNDNKS